MHIVHLHDMRFFHIYTYESKRITVRDAAVIYAIRM